MKTNSILHISLITRWLASSNSTLSYYLVSVTEVPLGKHVHVISLGSCLQTDRCYTGGRSKQAINPQGEKTTRLKETDSGGKTTRFDEVHSSLSPSLGGKKKRKKDATNPSPEFSPDYRKFYFVRLEASQITIFALQI